MKSKLLLFAVAAGLACAPAIDGADDHFTLIVTGDSIVTFPLSSSNDPAFLEIVDIVRGADMAIINLETVLRDGEGYAQRDGGGAWLFASGSMAKDLRWLGVDMVSHANNHTYDYGPEAIFSTHANLGRAGIAIAGSGKDLPAARAPAFANTSKRVGFVAMASTFNEFGAASPPVHGIAGRPGLNPLRVTKRYSLSEDSASRLQAIAETEKLPFFRSDNGDISLATMHFYVADGQRVRYVPDKSDWEGNLEQIRIAADNADYVVVSIHAHQKKTEPGPPKFLVDLAHAAIDAGADVFFTHGSHYLLGIEIYRGRPIFYGLGNFFYQPHGVKNQPWEFHQKYGTDPEQDYPRPRNDRFANPAYWFGVLPVITFEGAEPTQIRLIPLNLRQGSLEEMKGRPVRARGTAAIQIGQLLQQLSQPFGTTVEETSNGELLVRISEQPQ